MTFELEATEAGTDLIVLDTWSDDARAALEDGRADGLVLNYARGFRERDLGFLERLPVRRLQVLARTRKDLSPVYGLAETLESLRVQSHPSALIEPERLPHLRELSATWSQVAGSLRYAQSLTHVFLLAYDEPDLRALGTLPGLVSVRMKDRPAVQSLEGVEDLTSLQELEVSLASRLDNITRLPGAPPTLERLNLGACAKLPDLGPVVHCRSLVVLDVSECGEIPTLAPLAELDRLEVLSAYGSTRVADLDLGPIAGLPRLRRLRMQDRRGYTPTVKELQAGLTG